MPYYYSYRENHNPVEACLLSLSLQSLVPQKSSVQDIFHHDESLLEEFNTVMLNLPDNIKSLMNNVPLLPNISESSKPQVGDIWAILSPDGKYSAMVYVYQENDDKVFYA